jgi:sugar/nucleoside kinase (ribokinase family)
VTKVAAIKANVVDTTGAGDLYASGFLYGLIAGHTVENCGKIGSILAGRTIEVIGPKMTDAHWTDVKKMVSSL